MRRSASEVTRNLEMRVARLERRASTRFLDEAIQIMVEEASSSRNSYDKREAYNAIVDHLDYLASEEYEGKLLVSKRDYESFAKEAYRKPEDLAMVADQYLRGAF